MGQADIGLIGLAVMGQNLVLNMAEKGFTVAVHNRTPSKIDDFIAGPAKAQGLDSRIVPGKTIPDFIAALKSPRKVMMMVQAGAAVDEMIAGCLPYLEKGDVLIDGGNSLYTDTERRCRELAVQGILFIGAGVSGGEEGARHGPSIMPGGHFDGWEEIKPIFQKIAAKADDGSPCCEWVGSGGSGHYVKMVHNGIEYGDMQLICESYHLLRGSMDELAAIFEGWNEGDLNSYLIEITAKVLRQKQDGQPLLPKILDVTEQKGTGKWTCINALDLGIPATLISEAVFARALSALKDERVAASKLYSPNAFSVGHPCNQVGQALYSAKIISYAQGFMLMAAASGQMNWNLNLANVALMWRGGCIIRSRFLGEIHAAFTANPTLKNLLLAPFFEDKMKASLPALRATLIAGISSGTPLPAFSSALSFFDGYCCENLPANLLSALRDFFGAHTYQRIDAPRSKRFHTHWAT